MVSHGWHAFVLLGAVVLSVTGAEALYADMGHFGKRPIRLAWGFLVFPCLLLNYFGQGALLMSDPAARANPFYSLAPACCRFRCWSWRRWRRSSPVRRSFPAHSR